MTDVVCKFCSAWKLELNTGAGSLTTAKTFLQLTEHHRFVGCEKALACHQDALRTRVEVYATQYLNLELDVAGYGKAVTTSNGFVKEVKVLAPKKWIASWTLLVGLVPVQTFPLHIQQGFGMCTTVKRYFKSVGAFLFHTGLTSTTKVCTAWMWKRSRCLTRRLKGALLKAIIALS